jgi:hypothetical protein
MAKVSIGLRGWRFEESDIFDDSGNLRPFDEIPEDARNRLLRLTAIVGESCDACWLEADTNDPGAGDMARIVYGEPLAEVKLCREHEADFLYWFRECGGDEYAGTAHLAEQFHEWFDDGGRAPDGYGGLEHIDRQPEDLPDPRESEDLQAVEEQAAELDEAERDAMDLDLDDLDV